MWPTVCPGVKSALKCIRPNVMESMGDRGLGTDKKIYGSVSGEGWKFSLLRSHVLCTVRAGTYCVRPGMLSATLP